MSSLFPLSHLNGWWPLLRRVARCQAVSRWLPPLPAPNKGYCSARKHPSLFHQESSRNRIPAFHQVLSLGQTSHWKMSLEQPSWGTFSPFLKALCQKNNEESWGRTPNTLTITRGVCVWVQKKLQKWKFPKYRRNSISYCLLICRSSMWGRCNSS